MGGIVGAESSLIPRVASRSYAIGSSVSGCWAGSLRCAAHLSGLSSLHVCWTAASISICEAYHPSVALCMDGCCWSRPAGWQWRYFSSYFRALTGVVWNDSAIAAVVLLILTGVNCLSARRQQRKRAYVVKGGALAGLVVDGFGLGVALSSGPLLAQPVSFGLLKSIGSAMVPIAFAYGGWQTATFVAGEMRDPRRDLSRGLLLGVAAVVGLYLAVNLACLRVLGPAGLDATTTPASDVMRIALGERGAQWIAAGIAISTLGFLSQSTLTGPRVYYAMARDGLFFESVGKLSRRSRAPVVAIVLQGLAAIAIACSGTYGEILNFAITVDFIFFGVTAASLFILRHRQVGSETAIYRVPGHPFTTILFVLSCAGIVGSAIIASPGNSAIALCIMLAALPVYYYWSRFRRAHS